MNEVSTEQSRLKRELAVFARHYSIPRLLLTASNVDNKAPLIPQAYELELLPLSSDQIEAVVYTWFAPDQASHFLTILRHDPSLQDLAGIPGKLIELCRLYEQGERDFIAPKMANAVELPSSARAALWQRVRENTLVLLEHNHINPFLQSDLNKVLALELDKEYVPYKLMRMLEQAGQQPQQIPTDQSIYDVFKERGHRLLLLGPPGNGKTFTLIELAHCLATAARENSGQPIPILLNLSSSLSEKLSSPNKDNFDVNFGHEKKIQNR